MQEVPEPSSEVSEAGMKPPREASEEECLEALRVLTFAFSGDVSLQTRLRA